MSEETKSTMETLRSTLADRMLANEIHMSSGTANNSTLIEEMVSKLSTSLFDAAKRRGFVIVPGSSRAFAVQSHWLSDHTIIAAKVRAVLSDDPMAMVAMAVFMAEEARDKAEGQRNAANEWRGKYHDLMQRIAGAKNMASLKAHVRSLTEHDDD